MDKAGNPVLLFGDTNTRYTRNDGIRQLRTNAGMTDIWIQLIRNLQEGLGEPNIGEPSLTCSETNPGSNTCEVVDKIFYRSSPAVQLKPVDFQNLWARFLNTDGTRLSDHNPYMATLEWRLSDSWRMSDFVGGPHGTYFTDLNGAVWAAANGGGIGIRSVTLRSGKRVDNIAITRTDGATYAHGGNGGGVQTLVLNGGEHFVEATFSSGKFSGTTRVFSASFKTSWGRVVAGGTVTGDVKTFVAPAGFRIVGFWGRSGAAVDKIGLIYGRI
jgi:hypothetical protein